MLTTSLGIAARASLAVLVCSMEQGEVKGYGETDKLDRISRANTQSHVATSPNVAQNSQKKFKSTKVLTCSYFYQGTCVHQRSHDTTGIMYTTTVFNKIKLLFSTKWQNIPTF